MKAVHISINHLFTPIGIDEKSLRIYWLLEGGHYQSAYQIKAFAGSKLVWDSKKVVTSSQSCLYEGERISKERIDLEITIFDENGKAGETSSTFFEFGLLNPDEWKANWIEPELSFSVDVTDEMNRDAKDAFEKKKHKKEETYLPHQPSSLLRKEFELKEVKNARLYISARGLYVAYLNQKRIGDFIFGPGCFDYQKEAIYQSYDVSDLLQVGNNVLEVQLGDGWFRSTSGVDGVRNLYGDKIALFAQLEMDKTPILVSDDSWLASNNGPLRQNDMQQGEVYDANKEWKDFHPVKKVELHLPMVGFNSLPLKEKERFVGKIIKTPNGETVLDFSQNIAGYLEFEFDSQKEGKLTLICGEKLDDDGNFTQENFQDRNRHKEGGSYQRISYLAKCGHNHYKSSFTIMGFRYAKLISDLPLEKAIFTSIAVYSDMEETAHFESSSKEVNQLFKNSLWSMKGNFLDIPTDCPTRERAGWSGDASIFVKTGTSLMNAYPVYRKWLKQFSYGQYEDGRLANIAPRNGNPGFISRILSSSVGWGDACINIPYELYSRDGDISILEENYPMMKKWYGYLEKLAKKESFKSLLKKNPYRKYTIVKGMNYGEWCEPGANAIRDMMGGNHDVATAYFAHSGEQLAAIASLLGKQEEAKHYKETSELAKKAFYFAYTQDGKISSPRMCQYVRPIEFALLDGKEKEAAKALNELVIQNGYKLNTGFLSTPSLCKVLADYGYLSTAYNLLLQKQQPSWLYEVGQGATTVWETWDGKASNNHYSYGAISEWLLEGVCGIHYQNDKVLIRPLVYPTLQKASASYLSPKGMIQSKWEIQEDGIEFEIELAPNLEADFIDPNGKLTHLEDGKHRFKVSHNF